MQSVFNFDAVHFSSPMAEQAKTEGMDAASRARRELLTDVQVALRKLASGRASRTATADDGQEYLISRGLSSADLGNAAGSMFSRKHWEFTGTWTKSKRVSSHANDLRVWRLK